MARSRARAGEGIRDEEQVGRKRPFSTKEEWAGREGLGIIYDIIVPHPTSPAPTFFPDPCSVLLLGDAGSVWGWAGGTGGNCSIWTPPPPPGVGGGGVLHRPSSTTLSQALTGTGLFCCSPSPATRCWEGSQAA